MKKNQLSSFSIKSLNRKPHYILLSVLFVGYCTFCFIDISPTYTVDELESIYHLELSDLHLWYRKSHVPSLFTHKKVFYEFFGNMQYEGRNWYVSVFLADRPEFRPEPFKSKFRELETDHINWKENDVSLSICENLWFDKSAIESSVPYGKATFNTVTGTVWIEFQDNSPDNTNDFEYDYSLLYSFLSHVLQIIVLD